MIKEVEGEEFKNLVQKGLVLADFYSTTCGPCKMLSFVLKDVDQAWGDPAVILKVDFDQNQELAGEYEVTGYPTLILLKDGREVSRMNGLQQKPAIIRMIQEHQ